MNKIVFRSSINPQLMGQTLFRGTIIAGSGVSLLFFTGIFFKVSWLQSYGILIFCLSMFLVALGLLPYRKLQKLELKPDELWLTEDALYYMRQGKQFFAIPLHVIRSLEWVDNQVYGIGVNLNQKLGIPEKFIKHSQKKTGFDLFFPFFTKRSFSEIQEFIQVS